MQLNLERPDHPFVLRGADGSSALVNERVLDRSFIIAPDTLLEHWDASAGAALTPRHLEPLLAMKPGLVILGTGRLQVFPRPDVMAACLTRGIGVEVMTNAAAARTFNVLAAEGRRVVAGFVLG